MQANKLTDRLSVRGQITAEDVLAAKDAGFTTIVCNRPDGESPDQPSAGAIAAAASAAGLAFHNNPVTPDTLTPEKVRLQGDILRSAEGKVLAYCGSGRRSTILWMLANPDGLTPDERIDIAAQAGYDLASMRPNL